MKYLSIDRVSTQKSVICTVYRAISIADIAHASRQECNIVSSHREEKSVTQCLCLLITAVIVYTTHLCIWYWVQNNTKTNDTTLSFYNK